MQNHQNELKPLLLVFPYDVMAHYLRCLHLSMYLKPHFNIRFIYSERFHSFVTNAGFETFECEALNADKVQQGTANFNFSWLNEKDLNSIYHSQLQTIDELQPAAVMGDMCPTLGMAAEKKGVMHISLINGYMTRFYASGRRMPGKYPLYKLFNLLPAPVFHYFTRLGEDLFFKDLHLPFRKIRKRARLSRKYSYMQEMEGDINLVCDLPELFPQKDLPANYFLIPPLFHPTTDEPTDIDLDINKKTLYVSTGSTGNWKNVGFLNNEEYKKYNIVTAGDYAKLIRGANVFSFPFINSKRIFEATDLVICHGGNGTVYQALSHGIPALCKTSHLEQEYNVDGLERAQLGKSIDHIRNENDYLTTIEDWIDKKNCELFLSVKDKISGAEDRFGEIVSEILNYSFYSTSREQVAAHAGK